MNKKNPKIRFYGYTDDWEQRKLREVLSLENGYAFQSEYFVDEKTGFVVATPGNVSVEGGFICDGGKNYSIEGQYPVKFVFRPGDIFVTMTDLTPSANTLGKPAIVPDNGITYLHNQRLGKLVDFDGNKDYLFALLCTEKYHAEMVKTASGTTVRHSSPDRILGYEACFPQMKEQVLIGQFFKRLNNLITLHQHKYERLQVIKKSMLEKMFPKSNQKRPEIRFNGYTDEWEQRKLLDCIQKITDFRGRTPKKLGMDWSEEGYLALSALNVKDGYIDFNQDVHYGSQELYDKWMTGNELHKGQVLFTTEAPMGNVAQVPDNRRYILSQRTIAFDVKDDLITEDFLATVLRTPSVFADLTALSSGGTAKGVSQKSLSSVEIRLPKDLKEQERIADNFSNIDNLITLHQKKIEKLKVLKKVMLKQMII